MHMLTSTNRGAGVARQLFAALGMVIVVSLSAPACGSDEAATSVPSIGDDESALIAASDELVAACGDGDHARVSDLIGPGVQDRIRDQDNVFNDAVGNVVVVDRVVAIDDDIATVTVTLEVTIGRESSEVERVWAYERADDGWVLSGVHDCQFS